MLDKIILFSIKNKLFVGFMTLMLIFWGVWSATRLPIDAVPDITNNQVQIITSTPTLASQEVEQLVTFPISKPSPIFLGWRKHAVFPALASRSSQPSLARIWTSTLPAS